MSTIARARTRVVGLAAVAALSLAAAGQASAASVVIHPPTPESGTPIQTTDDGALIPLAWTAETSGCSGSFFSSRIDANAPGVSVLGAIGPSGNPPSGNVQLRVLRAVTAPVPMTLSVSFSCDGLTVSSETRTFTLVPPDKRPRLQGQYRTYFSGRTITGRRRGFLSGTANWRAAPICSGGTCTSRITMPGVGKIPFRWVGRKRVYVGSIKGAKVGKLFGCRRVGSSRLIRGTYQGKLNIKVRDTASRRVIVGPRTMSGEVKGSLNGKLIPTSKGRRLGCPTMIFKGNLRMSRQR